MHENSIHRCFIQMHVYQQLKAVNYFRKKLHLRGALNRRFPTGIVRDKKSDVVRDCHQICVLKNQGFSDAFKENGNELIRLNLLKFQPEYGRDFLDLGFFTQAETKWIHF